MSKMDGLRAMREARYEAARAGKKTAAPKPKAQETPAKAKAKQPAAAPEAAGEELCGHKAISGRTCTREKGHAAKSHRYA
ncbi:MAG: hypothetical protein Q8O61_12075 [Nocardioides sp.]|nr:hypothetical protein [Nocardioides sp.]